MRHPGTLEQRVIVSVSFLILISWRFVFQIHDGLVFEALVRLEFQQRKLVISAGKELAKFQFSREHLAQFPCPQHRIAQTNWQFEIK